MFRSQIIAGILSLFGFIAWTTSTMAQDPPQAKPVPSKSKKWSYAWAPEKNPIRGIILQSWPGLLDGEVVKGVKPNPWQEFLERNGIAWCDGTLDIKLLPEIGAELGRPELANAPVILTGLSSTGYHSIMLANKHPDRVLAVLGAQPVAPFVKGNDNFNFNRRPLPKEGEKQDEKLIPQDVTGALDVPIFMQIGEHDGVLGSVVAYGFLEFGRRRNAPWTYFCLPKAGHGNLITPKVAIPWLESVLAQRLPRDIDLTKGAPKLKTIPADAGLLGNLQSLTVAEHSKYDGNKAKANWMPDKASAEAWKESSRAMPYELPEQKVKLPSGLITDLVVHDPKHNTVVASDNPAVKAWKIAGNLKEGDTYCTTHWYHSTAVGKVPSLVRGYDWIVPDNQSVNFRGETLLEFTLSADATVYVGHDATIAKKPAWLADWKDTGEAVLVGYLGTEQRLNLYEKAFAKNAKAKLGANSEEAADPNFPKEAGLGRQRVIYMTIVKPKEAKNVPAGLRVMSGGHSWSTENSTPLCQAAGINGHKKITGINSNRIEDLTPLLEKGEIDAYVWQHSSVGPEFPKFLPTLVDLGPKHNPNFRVLMQMPWLVHDGRKDVKLPEEYEKTDLAEYQTKLDKSRKEQEFYVDEVNAKAGKRIVFLVPLGDGMLEVRKMIVAGKFPGITKQNYKDKPGDRGSVLGGDHMPHQGLLGHRLGTYMHFAALYRMSPEGLTFPGKDGDGLTDEQRAILQKLAWDMVSKYPYAGIAKFDAPKPPKEGEKPVPKSGDGPTAVPDVLKGWKATTDLPAEAVVTDYNAYIEKLPKGERPGVADVKYYVDDTGRNAVAVLVVVDGTRWTHLLVYDKQHKRTSATKYAAGK